MLATLTTLTIALVVRSQTYLGEIGGRATDAFAARRTSLQQRGETGQASAEYALVLLGAAGVALLFVAWATRTNRVSRLLDTVFDAVTSRVR